MENEQSFFSIYKISCPCVCMCVYVRKGDEIFFSFFFDAIRVLNSLKIYLIIVLTLKEQPVVWAAAENKSIGDLI